MLVIKYPLPQGKVTSTDPHLGMLFHSQYLLTLVLAVEVVPNSHNFTATFKEMGANAFLY